MAVDIGFSIRHMMLECKEAGIEIQLDGSNLRVRGNAEREDLYEKIKINKKTIVQAMTNIPEAVETHYLSRLRKGQEWLKACMLRVEEDEENQKLIDALVEQMLKWSLIDDEMRRLYPEHRGCSLQPIGGCDFAYIPVKCQECADE